MAESTSKQKLTFVTGKGGVGKSLIAAAIASEKARAGRKTLLVELGDTSYYQDLFSLNSVTHEPLRTKYGFDLALWGGESSLREYVLHYLRMEKLYKLFFDNRVMRALVNVAPGLPEIAMLGKITSGIRHVGPKLEYDEIVVDSFATGHTIALLKTPRGMKEAIPLGPMGHHSGEIDQILRDSSATTVVVVSLLEELPVVESLELISDLKSEFGLNAQVIANKVLSPPVSDEELKTESNKKSGFSEFINYLIASVERQKQMLKKLNDSGAKKITEVPQVFSTEVDDLMRAAGEALRGQIA